MLIPLLNIKKVYQNIINKALDCNGQGCPVYIFVTNDTDSLCALKMLTVKFDYSITLFRHY